MPWHVFWTEQDGMDIVIKCNWVQPNSTNSEQWLPFQKSLVESRPNVFHALHQVKNRSKTRFQKFISFCHLTMAVTSDIASPIFFSLQKSSLTRPKKWTVSTAFQKQSAKKIVFANYISFESALISLVHSYVVNQTDAFIKQPSLWISCKKLAVN